jgi:hypothetical protein
MSKTSGPDYERPVRLRRYTFTHTAQIYDGTHGGSSALHAIDATKGYVIELHLRLGIVRIWSTRFEQAKVTTVRLGDNDSWEVEGDVEVGRQPEGPRAA